MRIKRVLTDNGSVFRFKLFRAVCTRHGIVQKFTRTYRLQANGRAERFIQSSPREWAYGWTYQNSAQRTQALLSWQHHYNWHRPHHGIAPLPPMSRLSHDEKQPLDTSQQAFSGSKQHCH
ncbi:hypothetical protein CO613_11285 [Lysobacteraceae bacterium NML07-0707]|nr:hypothetical protein CO613_11285 [Xanthomonadaceae bacterium NML07-0707]